jgi:small redox-active disulfide protein 2
MKTILVLGTGCPKCHKLAENVNEAVKAIALDCQVEKVQDIRQIAALGVMMTPALAVDGRIVVTGRVPSVDELKQLLGDTGR